MKKRIKRIISSALLVSFAFCGELGYALDKKEEVKQYLSKVNPILTEVQVIARNISQRFWSPQVSGKQMQGYIDSLRSLIPPQCMAKQHKMILLSLEKLKTGFYALAAGNRPLSISLVKRGGELLRIAVKDIVDFAKKEGLVKDAGQE